MYKVMIAIVGTLFLLQIPMTADADGKRKHGKKHDDVRVEWYDGDYDDRNDRRDDRRWAKRDRYDRDWHPKRDKRHWKKHRRHHHYRHQHQCRTAPKRVVVNKPFVVHSPRLVVRITW